MCFDLDSQPPIPIAGAAIDASQIELQSADGTRFMAFAAGSPDPTGAAIVICPDVRGLHPYYRELAMRFAEAGVDAVAYDYFGRTADTDDRGESFEYMSHVQQATWPGLRADAAAAAAYLRAQHGVRVMFIVGFCFGGRLAFVLGSAPELGSSGTIGFYGSPTGPGRAGVPAPVDVASQTACPVLGLFGGADQGIPPDSIAAYDDALSAAGVEHYLVTYPDAPHSFFDRKQADYADASAAAWGEVLDFIRRHTPAR